MNTRIFVITFFFLAFWGFSSCDEEGDNPSDLTSEFVGTFDRVMDCGNGNITDPDQTVALGTQSGEVVFNNMFADWAGSDDVSVAISGTDFSFSADFITTSTPDVNWSASGTGTISGNRQQISYTFTIFNPNEPQFSETCSVVLTRK